MGGEEDGEGGWRGKGEKKLGKTGREEKRENFRARDTCAALRREEGDKGGGYPMPTLRYKE